MPSISTTIDVAAPPSTVWEVLTDYERYPEWNPFIVKISGDKKVGGRPQVTTKPPNKSSGLTFSPVIGTYTPDTNLQWTGRIFNLPGIFTGVHDFELHAIDSGTKFEQKERFSGALVTLLHLMGSDMFKDTIIGFELMDKALKQRAEEMHQQKA